MNKRIRDLAEQAGIEIDDDGALEPEPIYYITQETLTQFAELIVRRAMDYASQNWEHGHLLAEDLRVYFGVEK